MTADELFLKRRKAGVSLSEMANRAGISQGALVDIEKGRIDITAAEFARLVYLVDGTVIGKTVTEEVTAQ